MLEKPLKLMDVSPLVDTQIKAYNERDIDSFVTFFHNDIKFISINTNEVLFEGINNLKTRFKKLFDDNPDLHCEIKSRIIFENLVIDHELITGLSKNPFETEGVVIYHIENDLIKKVLISENSN